MLQGHTYISAGVTHGQVVFVSSPVNVSVFSQEYLFSFSNKEYTRNKYKLQNGVFKFKCQGEYQETVVLQKDMGQRKKKLH